MGGKVYGGYMSCTLNSFQGGHAGFRICGLNSLKGGYVGDYTGEY